MGDSPFWRFSLAFYAERDVAQACLELQDAAGIDVNVMLYLLFAARSGRRLDDAALDRIEAIAQPWRDAVVIPLRGVRRMLKAAPADFEPTPTAALRSDVKRVELAAEHLQQEALEQRAPLASLGVACLDPNLCAREHLALYGKRFRMFPDEAAAIILDRFAGKA